MFETETKRRERHRPGSVFVELTPAQRLKLEALRDGRSKASGVKETLAGMIRRLIMETQR